MKTGIIPSHVKKHLRLPEARREVGSRYLLEVFFDFRRLAPRWSLAWATLPVLP